MRLSPPCCRSVHPGHGVLLPGWDGSAAPGVHAARAGGRLSGLVALPGSHLLAAAHDGCCAAAVGGAQPQPQLLPHDGLPGGVDGVGAAAVLLTLR